MLCGFRFLTHEYAKHYEWVIEMDGNFTHSLTRLLDPSLRCKLPVLDNSADQCIKLLQSTAEKGDILKPFSDVLSRSGPPFFFRLDIMKVMYILFFFFFFFCVHQMSLHLI